MYSQRSVKTLSYLYKLNYVSDYRQNIFLLFINSLRVSLLKLFLFHYLQNGRDFQTKNDLISQNNNSQKVPLHKKIRFLNWSQMAPYAGPFRSVQRHCVRKAIIYYIVVCVCMCIFACTHVLFLASRFRSLKYQHYPSIRYYSKLNIQFYRSATKLYFHTKINAK